MCWGWGGLFFFFPQDFLPIENQRIFFHSLRAKIFFSVQNKNKIFFSKQHICSKCIFSDLYVRVFLEPNIHGYNLHGYIVYICSFWVRGCRYIFKLFLMSAI